MPQELQKGENQSGQECRHAPVTALRFLSVLKPF